MHITATPPSMSQQDPGTTWPTSPQGPNAASASSRTCQSLAHSNGGSMQPAVLDEPKVRASRLRRTKGPAQNPLQHESPHAIPFHLPNAGLLFAGLGEIPRTTKMGFGQNLGFRQSSQINSYIMTSLYFLSGSREQGCGLSLAVLG